jgi:hypothetical protein
MLCFPLSMAVIRLQTPSDTFLLAALTGGLIMKNDE